jgi:hypothetical protein
MRKGSTDDEHIEGSAHAATFSSALGSGRRVPGDYGGAAAGHGYSLGGGEAGIGGRGGRRPDAGVVQCHLRPIVLLVARPFGLVAILIVGFFVNALALWITAALAPVGFATSSQAM